MNEWRFLNHFVYFGDNQTKRQQLSMRRLLLQSIFIVNLNTALTSKQFFYSTREVNLNTALTSKEFFYSTREVNLNTALTSKEFFNCMKNKQVRTLNWLRSFIRPLQQQMLRETSPRTSSFKSGTAFFIINYKCGVWIHNRVIVIVEEIVGVILLNRAGLDSKTEQEHSLKQSKVGTPRQS